MLCRLMEAFVLHLRVSKNTKALKNARFGTQTLDDPWRGRQRIGRIGRVQLIRSGDKLESKSSD